MRELHRDPATGFFSGRVPAGPIVFDVFARGYVLEEERIARPGRNEITIRLMRAPGVTPVLKHGGKVVPYDDRFWISVQHVDGDRDGDVGYASHGNNARTFYLTRPGRYELSFDDLAGYKEIPDRTVTLKRGETLVVEVALEKQ